MSWSLRETRALAVKAAKGAGMPWGLAEEAGFAVFWLQGYGAPGAKALAEYLSWSDRPATAVAPPPPFGGQPDPSVLYCPISLGAAISDARMRAPADLGCVRAPLLLIPFVAAATTSGSQCLEWNHTEVLVSQSGFEVAPPDRPLDVVQAQCRLTTCRRELPISARSTRVPETEDEHIATLEAFAARTYAPATEQSRLTGAGSNLADND